MTTLVDKLEAFFRSRPNEWVDGRALATVAGAYAWRTRTSELRTQRGLTIRNRVRLVARPDGSRVKVSEYALVDPDAFVLRP